MQKFPDIITSREQFLEMQKRRDLTMADLQAVREGCAACSEVGGLVFTRRDAKFGRTTQQSVQVMGITENMSRIGAVREITAGPQPGRGGHRQGAPGGGDRRRRGGRLLPRRAWSPSARLIQIDNHPLRVVGVAERKGTVFGQSQDNFVWLPITHFRKLYGTRSSIIIQAQAASMEELRRGAGPGPRRSCAPAATSASPSPTTSASRPGRACSSCGRARPAGSTWSRWW